MCPTAPHVATRARIACLLGLTFTTGIIDALSWLGLDGVFTANMTGNVLIIGMGFAGAGGAHWFPPLFALICFLLGAGGVGMLQRKEPPGLSPRTTLIFGSVVGAILVLGVVTLFWPPHREEGTAYAVTGLLALAMGAQGAEAMRLAVPQLITVAVSSAVLGVGVSLFLGAHGDPARGIPRRIAAIALLALGAAAGSVLLRLSFAAGLLTAGVVAALVVTYGHVRRDVR